MDGTQLWKPKRWLATLLSLVLYASGLLYLGRLHLALRYWIAGLCLVFGLFFTLGGGYASIANFALHIASAIHSYKIASHYELSRPRPWFSHAWGIMASVLMLFVLPIFLVRAFLYEPYRLPADSMAPNFTRGDTILISKWGYGNYGTYGINLLHTQPSKPIQLGDVVVLAYPPEPSIDYIKRIVGLPSDRIQYKNKQLYVNDVLIERTSTSKSADLTTELPQKVSIAGTEVTEQFDKLSWTIFKTDGLPSQDVEVTLNDGEYFVLGDNRDNSSDSRTWGPVPAKNIKGVVIYNSAK